MQWCDKAGALSTIGQSFLGASIDSDQRYLLDQNKQAPVKQNHGQLHPCKGEQRALRPHLHTSQCLLQRQRCVRPSKVMLAQTIKPQLM
ncbi:hypothetical protein TNCV_3864451 [Trichonephila clavipes]|nr:hypothetical protein TNCV_3864451 [Trichonephila clavipes]